ncbi:MAG: methylmalonyl-CoA mutase [Chloroflexi bacterium]|nr:methylmalonyl-CoA mutase [Chloroflexota bacterium]
MEWRSKLQGNTMPAILDCVEAYCTTGEVCDVFRKVFGEYQETGGV